LWERLGLRSLGREIRMPDGGPSRYPSSATPGAWSRSPIPKPKEPSSESAVRTGGLPAVS